VLYYLLSGRHPYTPTARTPADLVHAVTQTEPARPSTIVADERVRRRLRGDLDTIVLAAMRKDPSRRYASVEQLSEDVRRHLAGLPVRARPDTVAYRATTFVRRNRLGVAAAALVLASLLGGIVGTTREARIARAERARAERRFDDVRTLATSFLFELHDAIVNLPGSTPARALLVRRALTSLDGLARDAQGDQRLQRELAAAYERVGRVQGNSYNSNLGDTEGAVASYRKSVAIRERVARADPQNDSVQAELADGYEGLGNLRSGEGEMSTALGDYERALALRRRVLARHPDALGYRSALAELENSIGDIKGQEGYGGLGDMTGALASYRESVALREDVFRATPSDREALVGLTNSLMNLGYLKAALGDPTGSGDLARSAALLERAVAAHPDDALWRLHLLSAYARLRQPAVDEGRVAEAIAVDRKSIVMLEALAAADRANTLVRRNLGVTYNYLGRDLRAAGRAREALPLHRRALAMSEGLAALDPKNGEHRHDVAITHFWLAEALADTRDLEGAVAEYRRAALAKEALRVAEPSSTRHGDDLARIFGGMARAQLARGALDAADDALREAVPAAEAAAARTATNQRAQSILAATYLTVGRLHVRRAERSPAAAGEWTEARRWLERGSSLWTAQRRRGTLSALDTASLHLATRELARCDAALAPGDGVP
jgi:non-specific serine/threonine protein kinase/serine/threonine-protein kinase